ncbi:MAG: recombination mediator RecR [Candidatus Gracilibacteria bacterium]|nr:recombination mediator RecR [Candidatus Gracilibacteria bacterium]
MMPEALKELINSIGYLPGIGEKSATKLAFFLLNSNKNYVEKLSNNMLNIKNKVHFCNICHSLTDINRDICNICSSESRNKSMIAVVEEYLDMLTLEESGGYNGTYHILGGVISPINGVFIGDLNFEQLFRKISDFDGKLELILATNPNIEGEATSSYITEEIEKRGLKYKVKITRLSRGLSSGYIEYADNITIVNALKERKEI